MWLNPKIAGLLVIVAGAITAGAYVLDGKQDKRVGEIAAIPKAAPAPDSIPITHPTLPASHPPVAVARPPPGADARVGRVQVDPTRAYTHFRVGNNSVISMYADGTVMWLGTSGGIVRYDTVTREFKMYDARNGLLSNGILYLGKLQGKISAGTHGGGLSLLNEEAQTWDHYNVPDGLGDAFVYDVLEASSGDVWIATGSGVNRVRDGALKDRSKWDLNTVDNTGGGLPNNRVYRLAEGRDGSLWFATRGGLANFQNGIWENWTHATGLGARYEGVTHEIASSNDPSRLPPPHAGQTPQTRGANARTAFNPNHIAALTVGKDGMVWAGTRGAGLARYDGKAWTNYTVAEGLPSNQIAALNFDRNDRLWVGTQSGLALFKNGRFRAMTTAHGLLADNVFSVTTTNDGDLWVGSLGGVAHIRRPALN